MGTQYGKKYDSDVVAYIKAVESADGALLETSVRALYYNFIVGCKMTEFGIQLKLHVY